MPLATGERLYARWQFQDYISTRAVQIVQVQHTCLPYYTLMQQWSDSFPVGYRVLRIYPDELQTAGGWNESLWLVLVGYCDGGTARPHPGWRYLVRSFGPLACVLSLMATL